MLQLPFTSDPWRTFSTVLSGTEYGFATHYNERAGYWVFDLSVEKSGQVLVAGVPILIGCNLLAPYGLGIGSLFAIDTAASAAVEATGRLPQSTDAGPDDLGTRVVVIYLAPGETV
jgi:hypothetical protein